jgi:nitrile hydratase accessory protein
VYERRRNLVRRADGCLVNVARFRGQLFVCATGCCCGRTADGFARVPAELYHSEWERRRLRNLVHLTIGGCLGPCALANVVLVVLDGQAFWFHSVNTEPLVLALYDHIEAMLDAGGVRPAPPALVALQFTASAWQPRPDGQPVDDHRPRRRGGVTPAASACARAAGSGDSSEVGQLVAATAGVPRKNGELVFDAPWQARVFGMAVALSEDARYDWEEFRQELIRAVAEAEASGGPFEYYEAWLQAFERLLAGKGLVAPAELDERTYQFEFGERDDVY